jgi:hypothetical protein
MDPAITGRILVASDGPDDHSAEAMTIHRRVRRFHILQSISKTPEASPF